MAKILREKDIQRLKHKKQVESPDPPKVVKDDSSIKEMRKHIADLAAAAKGTSDLSYKILSYLFDNIPKEVKAPPLIEVQKVNIVQQPKRRYRFTINRHTNGLISHVIVEDI